MARLMMAILMALFMNMMKTINKFVLLLVWLLLITNISSAQYTPTPVKNIVHKLQSNGIDTILIYMTGYGECKPLTKPNDCNCLNDDYNTTAQIIYKKTGKYYKIDFSCCKDS